MHGSDEFHAAGRVRSQLPKRGRINGSRWQGGFDEWLLIEYGDVARHQN